MAPALAAILPSNLYPFGAAAALSPVAASLRLFLCADCLLRRGFSLDEASFSEVVQGLLVAVEKRRLMSQD